MGDAPFVKRAPTRHHGAVTAPGASAARGRRAALWRLLRANADFRRLFLASVVSLLGDWFAFVAVSALVAELTGSPGLAAVVYAASVLPVFLASPLAGVVADRVDRRRLMIAVDVARIVPALGLLAAAPLRSPVLAVACVVAIATLSAFFEPVVSAVLPNLVDDADLPVAQAGLGSVWGTMLFVGAGLGGLVAATFGRDAAFLVDAASFAASAILLLRIRRPFQSRAQADDHVEAPATVLAHLGEVWAFARRHKVTRALLVTKAGVGVASGIVGLLPTYALDRFGSGDAGVGVLLAARGAGALLGPFVARAFVTRRGQGSDGRRLLLACGASMLLYATAYVFLPLTNSMAAAVVCIAVAHAGGGSQWVLSTLGLQQTTPDAVRGRVMSLDFGLATLAVGVSALLAGAAAEVWGLRATSWALVAVAATSGTAWLVWTRDLRRSEVDPITAPA